MPSVSVLAAQKGPGKYPVKKFKHTKNDQALSAALHTYRKTAVKAEFQSPSFREACGPALFMTNRVRERLVGLAHYGKVTSLDTLKYELRSDWDSDFLERHGPAILDLVNEHCPPPAPPKPRTAASGPDGQPERPSAKYSCRSCGKVGHKRKLFLCFVITHS
jgi:hypothetical protein